MHMAVFVDSETMSVKHLISLEKVLAESLLSDTCSSSLRELVRLFRQSPSFSITTHFRSSKPHIDCIYLRAAPELTPRGSGQSTKH